ncbi:ATP-binding protein [Streptomyces sp. NPDC002133]|uniref:ATP-binding response regulator n=1 Tax=Streptomyces sp. NPDC002133 TaxID=3154409 RepID=UPI00332C1E86
MPRVLLIEDDPSVREGVELGLRRRGHDVRSAATGEAGLAALGEFRPDLVLLDLMLPGIRVRLDPRRFDIVVANLVGNALRHGGAPVTVRLRTEARADGAHVLVTEVEDSGRGIRDDVLPHIFDRFYKADAARTRSAGSGLGLAITQENVRLHGGTVRAANAPGGGAVFTVEIPLYAEGATA